MKRRCKPCKEWEEHYYWNHLKAKGMCFFKVMNTGFSQGLLIPEKFAKNFKGKLPGILNLRSPSGNLWSVRLLNVPGALLIKDGWKVFVDAHHVVENDVLVFKYDGNSCFDVLMFNQSGCENEASYFVRCSNNNLEENQVKEEDNNEASFDTLEERCCSQEHRHDKRTSPGVQKNRTNTKPGSSKIPNSATQSVLKRRQITAAEEEKALQAAKAFETVNPSFIVVMQPSHVSKQFLMRVPTSFASLHFDPKMQFVIFRVPGIIKEWHVSYAYFGQHNWGFRGKEWQSFVLDNNLYEGDACVFELMTSKGEITMKRCKPCKEWEEHYYWNHFKAKGMCFFKVMDSGFSQGLLIPEKFAKNFKGKLPGTSNLRSPSGNLWSVRLLNVPGALLIKDGWKVFVDAHHVVEDDVLVFKYDGNSCFDVLMFNQSGCENEASYFVRSSNNNLEENQVKEEYNEASSDTLVNGSRRVFERCCSEDHRRDKRTSPGVQKNRTNYRRRNTKPGEITMKRRCKHCKEWEEHYYWNHLKAKGMCFFKVMDSGFSQGLLIPEKFAKNYKGKLPGILNLRSPSGSLWSVRLLNVPGALLIKDGWKVFVDAHHVVEDDVLVFKYDGNSCFDVLMFNQSGCENEASYFVTSSNNNLEENQVKEEDNNEASFDTLEERCCSQEHRHDKRTSPGVQKNRTNYRRRNTKPGEITMKRRCKHCKEWEEHYYWNHLKAKGMCFFKVMDSGFSQGLLIPEKFAKNFKGKLPGILNLRSPSGSLWSVRLLNVPGALLIKDGWKVFVDAHHVVEDDVLVFKYDGNSCFDVLMFNQSGCENEASYFVRCSNNNLEDNQVKEEDNNEASYDTLINGSRRVFEQSCSEEHRHDERTSPGVQKNKTNYKRRNTKPGSSKNTHYATRSVFRRRQITSAEEEKALQAAEAFETVNPSFIAVMWRSHVFKRFFMTVPSYFASLHFNPKKQIVILRVPGRIKEWHVRYVWLGQGWGLRGKGWQSFVLDNNLNEGDSCVFELIASKGDQLIPEKFAKNFKGKFPGILNLRSPSGNLWSVRLLNVPGALLIKDGWKLIPEKFAKNFKGKLPGILNLRSPSGSLWSVRLLNVPGEITMKRRCKHCKEWEEHYYWNHLKAKGMCFFKVMDSGFSQGLLIPEKFAKKFKGKLPGILNLRSPSGNLWSVRLLNVPGALLIKDGWKVFVDAHHVEENDVLVFKYDGNSCFDVLMFNQSECENEASYFVRCSNNNLEENQVKEEDNNEASSDTLEERCCSEEHRHDKRTSPGVQKNRTNYRRRNTKPGSSKNTNYATQSVLKRRQITSAEEEKALQAAKAFVTVKPSFIVVMCRSHVFKRFFMTVPSYFASLHFKAKNQNVILRVPGRIEEWHVRYASHGHNSSGFEGKVWQSFVLDNNLYEGDACVFELMTSNGEVQFNVHIFRAGQK
ncbi:hypothetical protein J5N97_018681 [Dioscorea zingiberensis]|uniref:TF-B3 domain-containing protein n=1 Tax=Dioscorea zingiberensis TaxID=325984 RepID=A0A9D5CDK0_9LILI|nr:hypothetical protein J5N97_018681 [Dioscorea zingiberensis]